MGLTICSGKPLNHPDSVSILDLRLGDFLARLGSSDPTPGGGAAAAVVGALGAALIEMTANLTIGKPRLANVEERARAIERRAADLRHQLERLGDADSAAFDRVTAAYRLPRADDAQKAARTQAIQAALHAAAEVPLQTARISAQVIELADEAAPILNAAVISDVLVGALLAQAALSSAALNVQINLAGMTDAATIQRYDAELARAQDGVEQRIERVLTAGRSRFPGRK
jgi:formiminotetrahydrofolate cyclodeaminase